MANDTATLDTAQAHALHADDDGHAHLPFLAHHFDSPQQQFDAGKLGIWIFLVTEVLFFSGMFCAYALYRSLHPEVWTFASQFLNPTLGAVNTGVLLFSSLTMAWAVRCAQLRQRTGLVVCLAITLGCASMFLGVKAVEYTHKWDMGLFTAGFYESQFLPAAAHHTGLSSWLVRLCIVPGIITIGCALWYAYALVSRHKRMIEIAGASLVTAACFFVGVFLAVGIENASHGSTEHADTAHESSAAVAEAGAHTAEPAPGMMVATATSAGSAAAQSTLIEPAVRSPGDLTPEQIDQAGGAGLFFSIYYCMTGVHAIHILIGMGVILWLLVRATKDQFNEQYFGPIDYVGLYWHLVDLIWIYLFPLLYLIK